jgi:carbonic anhydrase/acetyltransferase-like protein (isoleucine patch superfamily)
MIRAHRGASLVFIPASSTTAQVIGEVEIGEESSIWMCVVVRGDVNWIGSAGGRTSGRQTVHGMLGTHPVDLGDEVTWDMAWCFTGAPSKTGA